MNRTAIFSIAAAAFVLITAFTLAPPKEREYVGADACKMCHNTAKGGKVYAKWAETQHAKAYETLLTPEADKIAADMGYETSACQTDFCLSCHVTGMKEEGAKFDKKFEKSSGVQCESCHGAGSEYKIKHMKMEDPEAMKALGMNLPKVADGSAEELCVTCHNEKSPTYKPFEFEKRWAEIEHSLP